MTTSDEVTTFSINLFWASLVPPEMLFLLLSLSNSGHTIINCKNLSLKKSVSKGKKASLSVKRSVR